MEEQNKTTESGQAAADLDRSLGRLDAAAQLDRLVTDRAHSMRNACENLEQSDRLLAEKAKRKSLMDHILTIPLDGEDD